MFSSLPLRSLVVAGVLSVCAWSVPAFAAGPITIEQISSNDVLGSWTLAGPADWTAQGSAASKTIDTVAAGTFTLLVRQPTGATIRIQLIKNTEVVQTADVGQMTFTLEDGAPIKILVSYSFSLVGTVGAASDPSGLEFTISGPNGYTETGVTPWSWTSAPQGQYSLQFKVPAGCTPPHNLAQRLQAGERVSFSVTLDCAAADQMRQSLQKVGDQRVKQRAEEAAANYSAAVFSDVPKDAWFAPYIWRINQRSLMSGYKKADGSLTGEFGPERPVSVAELIAIAQRASGRSVDSSLEPNDEYATGQWFAAAYATAEKDSWFITFDRNLDPSRSASRREVVLTLLQALDVPVQWPHGDLFSDISPRSEDAAAIETMAKLGALSTDKSDGRLPTFRPDEDVNRAEMSKMLILLLDTLEEQRAKDGQ